MPAYGEFVSVRWWSMGLADWGVYLGEANAVLLGRLVLLLGW